MITNTMKAEFYVATNGNDANPGTIEEPFATLGRARMAVRELMKAADEKGLPNPVNVFIRGGKYYLNETLVLSAEDSGTANSPVTWAAYQDEKPVISGGRRITGWKPYKDKILKCTVPAAKGGKWKFRQLFMNGERQIRARWPKFEPDNPVFGGWAFIEDAAEKGSHTAFRYKPGTFPRRWAKPTQAEINIFPYINWGNNSIIPIKSIDEKNRVVELRHSTRPFGERWTCFEGISPFLPGNRFVVENLLEELDQPGEWCLDWETGILYFWPPFDSIEGKEIVAPVLDCLIDLHGASWITIAGFTFTETTSGDNVHHDGVKGTGAMFAVKNWKYCGDVIHLQGATHCTIEDNLFYAVGGNAVYLEGDNFRNIVQGNEISYAGANGICLLGTEDAHPLYNQVVENHIHHCGVFNKYVAGIFLGLSTGNVICHNLIEYVPHHAVNLGNSGFGRNIIEYNRIRHTCLETRDTAAINCWMELQEGKEHAPDPVRSGHIIRYNFISDAQGCKVDKDGKFVFGDPDVSGIYLDNFTSNCFVYGNIIVRTAGAGIFVRGQNNVIENNMFVDCGAMYRHDACGQYNTRFYQNIFSYSVPKVVMGGLEKPEALLYSLYGHDDRWIQIFDYNLFFNTSGGETASSLIEIKEATDRSLKKISFTDWQKMGYDRYSIVADPMFMDAAHDDYRLKSDSPAFKLGFIPIAIEKIGMIHKKEKFK